MRHITRVTVAKADTTWNSFWNNLGTGWNNFWGKSN